MFAKRFVLVTSLVLFVCILSATATDHNVTNDTELIAAFSNAEAGDIIKIAGGTYTPGDSLVIPAGVTIEGGWDSGFSGRDVESNATVIDGEGNHSLLTSNGTVDWILDGLTLTGGIAPYEPQVLDYNAETGDVIALRVSGSVLRVLNSGNGVATNLRIIGNNISSYETVYVAGDVTIPVSNIGSAIYLRGHGSTLIIENSLFTENFDTEMEYYSSEGPVLENRSDAVVFVDGIQDDEPVLQVSNTTFSEHTDTLGGSILRSNYGDLELVDNLFENNYVNGHIVRGDGIVAQIIKTVIKDNYAYGNLINLNADFIKTMEEVTVINNMSANTIVDMQDGEINLIEDCLVENNHALDGRIFNLRALSNEVLNSVIRGNRSEPVGQRIFDTRGEYVEIRGNVIENNYDARHNIFTLQVPQIVVRENIIRGNYTETERIINIHRSAEVSTEIVNNVIAQNSAQREIVHLDATGPQILANNTFYENECRGGSIITTGRTAPEFWIINNIFSGEVADSARMPLLLTDQEQPFLMVSNNLVTDWVGNVDGWNNFDFFLPNENGNFEGDPMFVEPPYNLSLQEGSDAIGAGMDPPEWPEWVILDADIVGTPRPSGAFDIGAYQGGVVISVGGRDLLPDRYQLSQNYPNPFNPTTTIEFVLHEQAQVSIEIFNILGQRVRSLVASDLFDAGYHNVQWTGTSDAGIAVPSGTYFYRMSVGDFTQVKKMMLLK
jgi:hypothetical protein